MTQLVSPIYEFAIVADHVQLYNCTDSLNGESLTTLFPHATAAGWEVQFVYFQTHQLGDDKPDYLGRAIGVLRRVKK